MKKILILVVISLAMYLSTFTEMKSDCPEYFTQSMVSIWVDGCEYEVDVCFKCQATLNRGEVNIISFLKVDTSCNTSLSTSQVLDAISNQVQDYDFIRANFCDIIALPCFPVNQGVIYTFKRAMCWMKIGYPDDIIKYTACYSDNTKCVEEIKVCYDPNFPPTFFRKTQISGPTIVGDFGCQGVTEPPGYPGLGIYSICFEVGSPCNP